MRTRLTVVLLGLSFVALGSVDAVAAVIYSQGFPRNPTASFTSSNVIDRQKLADNFLVDGVDQYEVRSLRVIGGYSDTSQPLFPLPNDDFRIVFLNDASGSPGTPLAGGDFSISSAVKRTPTDGPLLNGVGRPVEIILDLGEGITLDHGTEYWISVSNNPIPGSGWAWASGFGVFDQELASTTSDLATGPWIVGTSGGDVLRVERPKYTRAANTPARALSHHRHGLVLLALSSHYLVVYYWIPT